MGDPAGVGPEIIAGALAEPAVIVSSRPVVIGSAAIMKEALGLVGSPLALHVVRGIADSRWEAQTLECLDLGTVEAATLPRGEVSAAAGRAAYDYIERAIRLAQAGEIHGIVTAPVNKEALAAARVRHSGHTEILAELSHTRDYAMLLMGKELRVIHVTTHVALRRVPDLVTRDRVLTTIRLAQRTMEGLGKPRARIAVAGLNPHAGEDGPHQPREHDGSHRGRGHDAPGRVRPKPRGRFVDGRAPASQCARRRESRTAVAPRLPGIDAGFRPHGAVGGSDVCRRRRRIGAAQTRLLAHEARRGRPPQDAVVAGAHAPQPP